MYNIDVLEEANFWRDFLSDGRPRIKFDFGEQKLLVDSELLAFNVSWPGIPDDAAPFTHCKYEEDLFSLGDLDDWADNDFEECSSEDDALEHSDES